MGQVSAKAVIPRHSPFFPYLSLSFPELKLSWEAFNREAEGFALSEDQFNRILRTRGTNLNTPQSPSHSLSQSEGEPGSAQGEEVAFGKALFRVFDNDENGLVDALEVLCTIAVTSAVPLKEKITFLLAAYDFDNDGKLCLDELALMFKSTCNGLCKVSERTPPAMTEIESAAELCFVLNKADTSEAMPIVDIYESAIRSVEVSSWLSYYNVSLPSSHVDTAVNEEKTDKIVSPPPLAARRESGISAWKRQALELEPSPSAEIEPEKDFPCATLDVCEVLRYAGSPPPCFLGGQVIFATSGIVTLYFVQDKSFKYFTQHDGSVTTLATHEEMAVAATGGVEELIVWRTKEADKDIDVVAVLPVPIGKEVSCLAFDVSGALLLCITTELNAKGGASAEVMVFEWQKRMSPVWSCSVQGRIDCVLWTSAEMFVGMESPCEAPLVFSKSCHGEEWKLHNGIRVSNGMLTCATTVPQQDRGVERFLMGSSDGRVTVWAGWRETHSWTAFKGHAVRSLHCMDGRLVVASETKGFSVWEEDETSFLEIHRCNPGFAPVHSVRLSGDKCVAVIGSIEGIHLWNLFDAPAEAVKLGVSAQSSIQACCTSPRSNDIVCGVDESEAHIWQTSHSSGLVSSHPLPAAPTCCEMSFCGTLLAIGTAAPKAQLVVLSVENKELAQLCTVQTEPMDDITCLAFTPDKRLLIVGYSSGVVRSCAVRDLCSGSARVCWKAEGLVANGLVALDVSGDSSFCITNTSDDDGIHALHCDDLESVETLSDVKDVEWQTHRCLHAWTTLYDGDERFLSMAVRGSMALRGDNQGGITLQALPLKQDKRRIVYRWSSGSIKQLVLSKDRDSLFSIDSTGSLVRWHVDYVRSHSVYHAKEPPEVLEVVLDCDLPWIESVVKPRRPPKTVQHTPCTSLSVQHVHGWSFRKTLCNTVHYVLNDKSLVAEVVYPCGALLMCRSPEGGERIITGARDSISVIEVDEAKSVIAVGDASGYVQIIPWVDLETQATLDRAEPISCLRFSETSHVVAVATEYDIAVWNWSDGTIWTTCALNLVSVAFCVGQTKELLCCGKDYVRIYQANGTNLARILDVNVGVSVEPSFVMQLADGRVTVGSSLGKLVVCILSQDTPVASIAAHHGAINGIRKVKDKLITCAADGIVKVWALSDLELLQTFDIAQHVRTEGTAPGVRSLAVGVEARKILCATVLGHIVEISLEDGSLLGGQPVVEVEAFPFRCAAADGDGAVYVVDSGGSVMKLENNRMKTQCRIDCESKINCFTLSPNGKALAVGAHTLLVYTLDGKRQFSADLKHPVVCVRFAENTSLLGVASGREVVLFKWVQSNDVSVLRSISLAQHSRWLDFSKDSKFVTTLDKAHALQYWECANADHVKERGRISKMEAREFQTLPAGWGLQGLFKREAKRITALQVSKALGCVMIGYNDGSVSVEAYPCLENPGANEAIQISAVHKPIRDIKINATNQQVVVVTEDLTVLLEILPFTHSHKPHNQLLKSVPLCQTALRPGPAATYKQDLHKRRPTQFVDIRSFDCRGSLQVSSSGKLVCMGHLRCGISLTHGEETSMFQSASLIMALGLSPDRRVACTVDLDGVVSCWDANTGAVTSRGDMDMPESRCANVAFSPDGRNVCILANRTKGASVAVVFRIDPVQGLVQLRSFILDVAVYWMALWTLRDELVFGTYGEAVVIQRSLKRLKTCDRGYTCGVVFGEHTVLADDAGGVSMWKSLDEDPTVTQETDDPILCIASSESLLVTGHLNGMLRCWSDELEPISGSTPAIDLTLQSSRPFLPAVMSVDVSGMAVLALCQSGEVHRVSPKTSSMHLVMSGLGLGGEAWALDANPTDGSFATAGDDGILRIWAVDDCLKQCSSVALNAPIRSLAYSPDGLLIGVGFGREAEGLRRDTLLSEEGRKTGGFAIVSAVSLEVLFQGRDSKKWVRCCRFSPNNALFVVGGEDTQVHLYDCKNGFKRLFTYKGHPEPINALDFDLQSNFLRSQSLKGEIRVYGCLDGKETGAEEAFTWVDSRCVNDGAICADRQGDLSVTGYEDGGMVIETAGRKDNFRGHWDAVGGVRFLREAVVSLGRVDKSVCVWRLHG